MLERCRRKQTDLFLRMQSARIPLNLYVFMYICKLVGSSPLSECAAVAYSGGTWKILHLSPCHSNVPAGYVRT